MNSEPHIPGDRLADETGGGPGLMAAFTLVVWVACVAVGVTGLAARPARPPPTTRAAVAVPVTQVLDVSLEEAPPAPTVTPAAMPAMAPAAAAVPDGALLPAVPTVALPSAAIAFAVPVEGPARVGPASEAVPVGRATGPVLERLTLGVGVGDQPKPDYPDEARVAGQQGAVTVGMSIDVDGHVSQAWVAAASPFSSLNAAALDVVRDHWRFPAGPPRRYEVPITFRLNAGG